MSQVDGGGMGLAEGMGTFGLTARARQVFRSRAPDVSTAAIAGLLDDAVLTFSSALWREVRAGLDRLAIEVAGYDAGRDPVMSYPEFNPGPVSETLNAAGGELPIYLGPAADVFLARFMFVGTLIELRLVEIELIEGSIIGKLKAAFGGPGAGLVIMVFLLSPTWSDVANDGRWNTNITRIMDGQICETRLSAHYDIEELRGIAVEELMIESGTIDAEMRLRICTQQLLLRLNGSYPGAIDGEDGPETRQAKVHFAGKVGLTEDQINDRRFYEALLDGIHRKP